MHINPAILLFVGLSAGAAVVPDEGGKSWTQGQATAKASPTAVPAGGKNVLLDRGEYDHCWDTPACRIQYSKRGYNHAWCVSEYYKCAGHMPRSVEVDNVLLDRAGEIFGPQREVPDKSKKSKHPKPTPPSKLVHDPAPDPAHHPQLTARKAHSKSSNTASACSAATATATPPSVASRAVTSWKESMEDELATPFGCFLTSTPGFCCDAVTENMIGMNCDKAVMVVGPNEDIFYSCPKSKQTKQAVMSACCMPIDTTVVTPNILLMGCMVGIGMADYNPRGATSMGGEK